jgi:hypothetical protein
MSYAPVDELPRVCEVCENALADIGRLCIFDAIQKAVDDDQIGEAFSLAFLFGLSHRVVQVALRTRAQQKLRSELAATRIAAHQALAVLNGGRS